MRTTHDYAADVANPLYLEAEERVLNWLRARGKHVTDNRSKRTFHDFTIGNAWTLDVKCDVRYAETGRVAWEQLTVRHNGPPERAITPGWGMHHGLSYIVYVLCPPPGFRHDEEGGRHNGWPLVVVHAGRMREAILANKDSPAVKGFIAHGTDRDGTGYAVELEWLRQQPGVVLEEGEC